MQEMGILVIVCGKPPGQPEMARVSLFSFLFFFGLVLGVEEEESFLFQNPYRWLVIMASHYLPSVWVVPINLTPVIPLLSKAPSWALDSLDNLQSVGAKCLIFFFKPGIEHRTITQEQPAETYEHV